MFETLRQTHGAATLRDVQRVKDDEQRAAFNGMHQGDFAQMLKVADERGGVHWTTRQSDTLKEMAARYTADLAADADPASGHPVSEHGAGSAGKKRFMFAATNKDVAALNAHARELHRAAGKLGEDHALSTKHGSQAFAEGDRIQFTGNGRTKAEKNAGLVNGRVGSVEAITLTDDAKPRVTVALDAAKGAKPQRVSFVVGDNAKAGEFNAFKHGYAGTIYRGQGRTLDETYLAHTGAWRASASYVALTRHREAVHIFAARETVKDLDAMARGMARIDNKRAATAYSIDAASAARAGLDKAVAEYAARRAPPAARGEPGSATQEGAAAQKARRHRLARPTRRRSCGGHPTPCRAKGARGRGRHTRRGPRRQRATFGPTARTRRRAGALSQPEDGSLPAITAPSEPRPQKKRLARRRTPRPIHARLCVVSFTDGALAGRSSINSHLSRSRSRAR